MEDSSRSASSSAGIFPSGGLQSSPQTEALPGGPRYVQPAGVTHKSDAKAPDATPNELPGAEARVGAESMMGAEPVAGGAGAAGIRERIVNAAYELISRSGVAKATFYRHFASKDQVVLAFLEQRDRVWTVNAIVGEARRRADTPEEQLLAIFDVFADWFRRTDFEACSFINVLLEMGSAHPLGRASIDYLAKIRGHVKQLADEAGLERTEDFSRSWHILMKGSIISAAEGDVEAARRARQLAGWLIEHHRA